MPPGLRVLRIVSRRMAWCAALKEAIGGSDRELIHHRTHELNDVTKHLAEVMMNKSLREALAGRSVDDV